MHRTSIIDRDGFLIAYGMYIPTLLLQTFLFSLFSFQRHDLGGRIGVLFILLYNIELQQVQELCHIIVYSKKAKLPVQQTDESQGQLNAAQVAGNPANQVALGRFANAFYIMAGSSNNSAARFIPLLLHGICRISPSLQ